MKVNTGDIFKLGDHILGCGSSLDSAFVAKVIGGGYKQNRDTIHTHRPAFKYEECLKDSKRSTANTRFISRLHTGMAQCSTSIPLKLQHLLHIQLGPDVSLTPNRHGSGRLLLQPNDYLGQEYCGDRSERLPAYA